MHSYFLHFSAQKITTYNHGYLFAGLSFIDDPWWCLICEGLEVFTMSLMWVAAVLYMHHLAPRHLTATGQALATVSHFCIGKSTYISLCVCFFNNSKV